MRFATAPVLLAQCVISGGVAEVIRSAEQYNNSRLGLRWLHGKAIRLTPANASGFTDWYENAAPDMPIGGQALFSSWPMTAATQDQLPRAVCGPASSASRLYDLVYAHWPKWKNANPWRPGPARAEKRPRGA